MAGPIEGSTTAVGGVVYVGAWDGYEYALNATNGSVAWRTYLGVTQGTCTYAPKVGITSTAAVVNGTLFVGGGDSYWYALNASTGRVLGKLWVGANGAGGGNFNWASPLIVGHFAYIGIASECDNPIVRGGLLMVDISDPGNLSNSSVVHRFYSVPSGQTGGTIWGTPAYDVRTQAVYVATGNPGSYTGSYSQAIIKLNASTLKVESSWQILNTPNSDSDFSAGPMLFNTSNGSLLVVAANKDGFDYALNATNLSSGPVWEQQVALPRCGFPPTAFDGRAVYLSGGCGSLNGTPFLGSIRAVTPENRTLWVRSMPGFVLGGASVANGVVAVAGVSLNSGAQQWFVNTTVDLFSARNGTLLGSIYLPDRAVNSTITIADGQVYIAAANQTSSHGGEVRAYDLPLGVAASAKPVSPTSPGQIDFIAVASGGAPPYLFNWSFGDGGSSSLSNATHAYQGGGNYTASLTVTDALGDRTFWSRTIDVTASQPLSTQLAVRPLVGVAPLRTNGSAVAAGGVPPYEFDWSFGDGVVTNGTSSVSHVYRQKGVYTFAVTVRDGGGRLAFASDTVNVLQPVAAQVLANYSSGPAPLAVGLSAWVTGGRPPYVGTWAFGDGSPNGSGLSVNHTFAGPGNYSVWFQARDGLGNLGNGTLVVSARATTLVVDFFDRLWPGGCPFAAEEVRLVANVSGGWGPDSFTWTFGDGSPGGSGPVVFHNYTQRPPVTIQLVTHDALGDQAALNRTISWVVPVCETNGGAPTMGGFSQAGALLGVGVGAIALAVIGAVWISRRGRARRPPGAAPNSK